MKKFVTLIALLFVSACAASGGIEQISSAPPRIDSTHSAGLTVTSTIVGKDEAVKLFEQAVLTQLVSKKVFNSIQAGSGPSDVRIEANIVEINEVTQGARVMLGALAGQAMIKADIVLKRVSSGEVMGRMLVRGESSGGHIFAGTTQEAADQAATQLVDFLLRNRQI